MSLDLQPTLHGRLLTLRPLRVDDYDALYLAASDPLIWEQHPEPSRYMPEVFSRYFESAVESKGAFVAIDNATGNIVGSSRYCRYAPENSNIEVGYTFLVRSCWASGYNKDMKRLMLGHAFTSVHSVLFYIGQHNYRSQKAVEKTGATLYETTPGVVVYRLTKEQWERNTAY